MGNGLQLPTLHILRKFIGGLGRRPPLGGRLLFACLLGILLVAGCGGDTDSAKDVVRGMYEAVNKGDTNAYMDTLLPSTRSRPDVGGIIWQLGSKLSVGGGAGGLSASMGLGSLLTPTTRDMKYRAAVQDDGHIVVEARGKVRVMMGEFDFCDSHDVVKEGGKWYIDRFHPARQPRMQRFMERNLKTAESQGETISGDALDLGALLNTYGEGMEIALNLCE